MDNADALRAKRRTALAQLDTLTQSIFLDIANRISGRTRMTTIEEAMEAIIDYRGKSPTKTSAGVPLITARVVKDGELLDATEFIANADYDAWMRRGLPQRGDVVFTTEAPLGEVAQLDGRRVALAQRLLVLRGKAALVDNTYLKHALTMPSVRSQIEARATGSTVKGIRQSELRQVAIPIPPLELQQAFATRVRYINESKSTQRRALAAHDALFPSLQHFAFRGEL